jgi:hypothetical protein
MRMAANRAASDGCAAISALTPAVNAFAVRHRVTPLLGDGDARGARGRGVSGAEGRVVEGRAAFADGWGRRCGRGGSGQRRAGLTAVIRTLSISSDTSAAAPAEAAVDAYGAACGSPATAGTAIAAAPTGAAAAETTGAEAGGAGEGNAAEG